MDNNMKSANTPVIVLLAMILIAVLGIGGYFLVKDITSPKKDDSSSQTQNNDNNNNNNNNNQNNPTPDNGGNGNNDQPVSADIDAGITVAEIQGNNFHIELQTNGVIYGQCDISLIPTDGSQGPHSTVSLNADNKISVCTEDFSLKGMNPGEHKLTVMILSTDGRTKTLEQIVRI